MRRSISAIAAALIVALILPAAVQAAWPVATRASYLSQGYSSHHRADDIAAAWGTPIVPIRSGKVVFVGRKDACAGLEVYVSHGNGLYSTYFHMSSESVYRGQLVTRQVTRLGRVGESGCATGPHVHVEVWRGYPWRSGSYRINPWSYVDSGEYLPSRYDE
jgi:murein DD-endopeptidase MepM/ murein hydrolase activator NlpD